MKVTIRGTPQELAALVRATQERKAVKIEFESPVKTMTQVVYEAIHGTAPEEQAEP